jgi:hypothetical protein
MNWREGTDACESDKQPKTACALMPHAVRFDRRDHSTGLITSPLSSLG